MIHDLRGGDELKLEGYYVLVKRVYPFIFHVQRGGPSGPLVADIEFKKRPKLKGLLAAIKTIEQKVKS